MNIAQNLVKIARTMPNKIAVRCEGQTVTYRVLDIQSNRIANTFRDLGIGPGHRALVMIPDGIDRVVVHYALAKSGIVEVPVYCESSCHRLRNIVAETKPKVFIGAEPYLEEIRKVFSSMEGPSLRFALGVARESEFIDLESAYANRPEFPVYEAGPEVPAEIVYAGSLKGVVLTHGILADICDALALIQGGLEQETVAVGPFSLHKVYGVGAVLNGSICRGIQVELYPGFDAKKIIALVERERHTVLYAVPPMISNLMETIGTRSLSRRSLRFCMVADGSVPPDTAFRFEELFGVKIFNGGELFQFCLSGGESGADEVIKL